MSWEIVTDTKMGYDRTERLKVPGGWLYRNVWISVQGPPHIVIAFVPDISESHGAVADAMTSPRQK